MLTAAQVSLGNNRRLQRVIERAQAGEELTIVTIGGSVTEGAGAAKPAECYASRFAQGFRDRYGAGGEGKIRLLNAGVGGTASTFGMMRYAHDVLPRVRDEDGLPDLVVVEFAVNDFNEPTKHRCYESLVKQILEQPNEPAVILLFAVFWGGWNLQDELKRVGETYDLMMVSIRDSAYPHVGKEWTREQFFADDYHPTSFGHGVMADCLLAAVEASHAQPTAEADINLDVKPAFGTDYMDMRLIFADMEDDPAIEFSRGSFTRDDTRAYKTAAMGRICGKNFSHDPKAGNEPIRFKATFRNLLIAWRSVNDTNNFGRCRVTVDGQVARILGGGSDSWGQSDVTLVYTSNDPAEHVVEISMMPKAVEKQFTVTCIGFAP